MPSQPLPRLILGSSSPYRRELLERLRVPFEVAVPDIDETPLASEAPEATALRLSLNKAQAIARRHPGTLVIGSDQVLTLDGRQMGKPGSHDKAREQLRLMRGRTVIAIAHRLATLRNFDRVIMLQGGRIIEDGPPDRLMQGGGPYRELVAREMSRLATHAA